MLRYFFVYFLPLFYSSFSYAISSSETADVNVIKNCTFSIVVDDANFLDKKPHLLAEDRRSDDVRGTAIDIRLLDDKNSFGFLDYETTSYALTSFHVVDEVVSDKKSIYYCTEDGENSICSKGELKLIDKKYDLAILAIPVTSKCNVKPNLNGSPSLAMRIFTIGNKLGLGLSFTSGFLSLPNKEFFYKEDGTKFFHLLDANVGYGNSGGGVFSDKYEFLGILKGLYSSGSSFAMVIPVSEIGLSLARMKKMKEMESLLSFEIIEFEGEIFLKSKNHDVPFEHLFENNVAFNESEPLRYIEKKPVKLKADFIYSLFTFMENESRQAISLNTFSKEKRFRRIKLRKKENGL